MSYTQRSISISPSIGTESDFDYRNNTFGSEVHARVPFVMDHILRLNFSDIEAYCVASLK